MKKVILFLAVLFICFNSFANSSEYSEDDNDFTWAKFEVICYDQNIEPTIEKYNEMMETFPDTDFGEDEEFIQSLLTTEDLHE